MTGQNMQPSFLTESLVFPSVERANAEGLLAVGGDLSVERLLLAYKSGIFPWFNDDSMILWWSPDPRMVLYPEKLNITKSMRKLIRNEHFTVTKNKCFSRVVEHCAQVKRKHQEGTWITKKMQMAYLELHKKGYAESYEVWEGDSLVGGLYGVDLKTIFCGESMFSLVSNASKYGFIHMVLSKAKKNYQLIDCQLYTQHLESLGAEEIPRSKFIKLLKENTV
jgi:leucyl/phenylalanyl-tRNA--protein transferase